MIKHRSFPDGAHRCGAVLATSVVAALMMLGASFAQELPQKGSPLRAELLDAARPAFMAETGGPIEFVVRRLAVLGDWAFGDISLRRPDGQPIDWMQTKYADDLRHDMFNPDYAFFLLKRRNGGWSVAEISVGPTDVAWDWWRQKYNIPGALFGQ